MSPLAAQELQLASPTGAMAAAGFLYRRVVSDASCKTVWRLVRESWELATPQRGSWDVRRHSRALHAVGHRPSIPNFPEFGSLGLVQGIPYPLCYRLTGRTSLSLRCNERTHPETPHRYEPRRLPANSYVCFRLVRGIGICVYIYIHMSVEVRTVCPSSPRRIVIQDDAIEMTREFHRNSGWLLGCLRRKRGFAVGCH